MTQPSTLDRWWSATPSRDRGADTFAADLELQCRRVMVPGTLLCVTAWLPYLWLDRQIHPELPVLPLLRGGLTVIALLALALAHVPALGVRPTLLAALVLGWLQVGAGTIAGLTGGEPAYVGGFILLLAIGPAIPLPRRVGLGLLAAAFTAAFAMMALGPRPSWDPHLAYSWTDLLTAGVVSALLIYAADAVRHETWQRGTQIRLQSAALERALLAPVVPSLPLDAIARAKAEWREGWVLVWIPAGQVDLARALPAQALATEAKALGDALDAAAAAAGLLAAEALDGARVYVSGDAVPREGGDDASEMATALQLAAASRDAELAARGLPGWQVSVGSALGPIVLARAGSQALAYDVWHQTLATARAAAAQRILTRPAEVGLSGAAAMFDTAEDPSTRHRPRAAALRRGEDGA